MNDRAVSSPVGVILIIGMTVASVATLFAVGGAVISDTRADAERTQMENAISSFSSKASLVGLGESGDQRFSLGRASEGDVTIQPDAGTVTLKINSSGTAASETINSTSLGTIVYQSGDTEIAYQGGGVWKRSDGYTQMISPPEYHYQLNTLTFPIMTVRGDGRSSGSVRGTVKTGDVVDSWFPDPEDDDLSNPLDNGTVSIEVESRYCSGWESFFRERSQGSIAESCGEDDTVVVDLVVPFELTADKTLRANEITPHGSGDNSDIPDDWEEGIVAPSVSDEVEARIESCESDCNTLPSSETVGPGEYWVDGDYATDGNLTFNPDEGDITAAIDGDLDLQDDVEISSPGNVTLYVKGNVDTWPREYNTGGDAGELIILVHSDADTVEMHGSAQYTGIIYAPGSEVTFGGATDVRGSVVGDAIEMKGNAPVFERAPELDGHPIVGEDRPLTYLHVSENPVEVAFD